MRRRPPADVRVLVVGATGYIGKFVVKELVKRGYQVVAFARERSGIGGKASADDTRRVCILPLASIPATCGRSRALSQCACSACAPILGPLHGQMKGRRIVVSDCL